MALSNDRFRLDEWLVDPSLSRVTKDEKEVHLEPRAMEVLVYLAGRADQLVSKQDLIDHVWQEGHSTIVATAPSASSVPSSRWMPGFSRAMRPT
jgi:DNA-binding winged helix-turn-helix (wHTH) protein